MTRNEIENRRRRTEEMRGVIERRTAVDAGGLELRSDSGGELTVSGYATTFNSFYDVGSYREQVAPTALTRTLSEQPDVVFTVNHGLALSGIPLARTRSRKGGPGTLELGTDDHGLFFTAAMDAEDPDAQALARAIRNGTMSQCSWAFRVLSDDWNPEMTMRTLTSVSLHGGDCSCVSHPANPDTSIDLRSRAMTGWALPDYTTLERERLLILQNGQRGCRAFAAVSPLETRSEYERVMQLKRGRR